MISARSPLMLALAAAVAFGGTALATEAPAKSAVDRIDATARDAWNGVRGTLMRIVDRKDRQPDLPKSSWFGEDRKSNKRKINELMDEALSHLEITELSKHRKAYSGLDASIRKSKSLIAECMEKRITAPAETGLVEQLWKTTRSEYDAKIKKLEENIEEYEKAQKEIVEKMRTEMARMGVRVTNQQTANLLLVVSGDSFLDLSSSFHNIKQLTDVLAELVRENEKYIQNSKRYYGMYVSLVGILLHAHKRARNDIEKNYIPQIEGILEDTKGAAEKTNELIDEHKDDPQALERLRRNIEAQAVVTKAAESYLVHLNGQLVRLTEAQAGVRKQYEIALNTYQTVDIAASLLDVIKTSLRDLGALRSMQLPEMLPLETERIREQFQSISDQLRKE